MINENRLSAEITTESMTAIIDHVKGIETELADVAISVSVAEKKSLIGAGPKILEFMDKALEYAEKNPELIPGYLDLEEFKRDLELTRKLWVLHKHILPLMGRINDTLAAACTDSYSSSRQFYKYLQTATSANLPGTATIVKELGKLFKRTKTTTTATTDAETDNVTLKSTANKKS